MHRRKRLVRTQGDAAFEFRLGVVGEKPVRVVDDAVVPTRGDRRAAPPRLAARSTCPTRVIQPAVDDRAEVRPQPLGDGGAEFLGRLNPVSIGLDGFSSVPCAARTSAVLGPSGTPCSFATFRTCAAETSASGWMSIAGSTRTSGLRDAARCWSATVRASACVKLESAVYIGATIAVEFAGNEASARSERRLTELVGDVNLPVDGGIGCGQRLADLIGLAVRQRLERRRITFRRPQLVAATRPRQRDDRQRRHRNVGHRSRQADEDAPGVDELIDRTTASAARRR